MKTSASLTEKGEKGAPRGGVRRRVSKWKNSKRNGGQSGDTRSVTENEVGSSQKLDRGGHDMKTWQGERVNRGGNRGSGGDRTGEEKNIDSHL